jgi:hypothetical protein
LPNDWDRRRTGGEEDIFYSEKDCDQSSRRDRSLLTTFASSQYMPSYDHPTGEVYWYCCTTEIGEAPRITKSTCKPTKLIGPHHRCASHSHHYVHAQIAHCIRAPEGRSELKSETHCDRFPPPELPPFFPSNERVIRCDPCKMAGDHAPTYLSDNTIESRRILPNY